MADKKALIVTDMLRDFVDPAGVLYIGPQGRDIIPFIQEQAKATRAEGGVVIYVCDAHAPDDREFRLFPPHAVKGTPGAQIIPELAPLPGDYVVEKVSYNCFVKTDLEGILRREQVSLVEVVGVCTSICVLETARGLFERDIPCRVYRAGVADFDPEAHAFALKYMARILGVEVV
jgi:nicotinamidase/pyrazinamidase